MAFGERLVLKKYVCINICIIIIIIYRFLSGGSEDDLTNFSLEKSNENSFLGGLYNEIKCIWQFQTEQCDAIFFNLSEYNILSIFEKR